MASSQVLRANPSRKRRCQVAFSYNAQNDDELDLKVGEIIYGLREVEEGWWEGRKKAKEDGVPDKTGVFPSNFVKLIGDDDGGDDVKDAKPEEDRTKHVQKIGFGPLVTKDALANFRNKKEGISTKTDDGDGKPSKSPVPSPKPSRPSLPKQRLANVLFDYEAVHEDELSIKEGDVVIVLETELEDPGWWKGCVKGKESKIGVFPDNFVDMVEGVDNSMVNSEQESGPKKKTMDKPVESASSLSPQPSRPLRPTTPTGLSSKNSTLESDAPPPRPEKPSVGDAPQRPEKPTHLLDKASKKLGDIFGPRASMKKPPPPPVATASVTNENVAQPVPLKPNKPNAPSIPTTTTTTSGFGSFKRKTRSATPPSPMSCSGGSSETLDDSTESLDRSGGEGTLERTGSGRHSGGGRSSTSGCSSGGAISPTVTLDDVPATEILPSLTAKRAMKKKGVRPPSGLFINEMGRQTNVSAPPSTASGSMGRAKSADNVLDSSRPADSSVKEESKSGDSTPENLDVPVEAKKSVSPSRPKPPPGAISVFPFGNPQVPSKKPVSPFHEPKTSTSPDAGTPSASAASASPAVLPSQVKPEKKPRPPSLIKSRIKDMQDSIASTTSSSEPSHSPAPAAVNNVPPSAPAGNSNFKSSFLAARQSAAAAAAGQQPSTQPVNLHRPTRPLPPKQPSPNPAMSSAPTTEIPPVVEAPPTASASGHLTISDGVVTSSSTDDVADSAASALDRKDKRIVNGIPAKKPEEEDAQKLTMEELRTMVATMKREMVSREEHERVKEELRECVKKVEALSARLEGRFR